MTDLLAARLQMTVSLGFHIIFACIGMAMPFLMAAAEYKYNKTGNEVYLKLAKAWSKGVAIFFAVGAVSGTVLSFELGLLWPGFMQHAGAIIGMPFSLEGTAFFLEAIAIGLYLYGWNRLNKWTHWTMGLVVGISGIASGIFVVAANGWMNAPAGFTFSNGVYSDIDPIAAMFNAAWFTQALHMTLSAFISTAFAVAGVHAIQLLKNPGFEIHKKAIKIALLIGSICALLQPFSGDLSAKDVAKRQPAKFAAMEALFVTQKNAPLIIGGIPDENTQTVSYAIHIPYLLSFLAHGNLNDEVIGLDKIPLDERPPVAIVHYAFQIMVLCGVLLIICSLTFYYFLWRRKDSLFNKFYLKLLAALTPVGFIAVEAGWVVTEVGRQPWIIYKIMRIEEALTPMPWLIFSLIIITIVYLLLSLIIYYLMKKQIASLNISLIKNA